jgi:hypothetical protein
MQRLAYLLHRLADDIAAHGDDPHGWSRQVRQAGDLIGRGKPWGLGLFLKLFEEVGRPGDQPYPIPNPFTEQPFARTPTCDEAYRLAYDLEGAHWLEESRLRQPDRDIVLRPWREGGTGKAVVYEDGTVVATQDGDGGDPHLPHIKYTSTTQDCAWSKHLHEFESARRMSSTATTWRGCGADSSSELRCPPVTA